MKVLRNLTAFLASVRLKKAILAKIESQNGGLRREDLARKHGRRGDEGPGRVFTPFSAQCAHTFICGITYVSL